MTEPNHTRLTDRTAFLWAVAVAAVLIVALVATMTSALRGPDTDGQPTASPTDQIEPDPARPALHITPEKHWMNDPQRPFFAGGRWHAYYLYNADYPDGNGTEWYHVTSTDLVTWTDEGVAIEKYENGLGDIQSGSAVVDTENTAGFGAGAIIALVTQQHDGVQRQSLFYSIDHGYTFAEYDGNPVMQNPGVHDFRDPKVVWDGSQWVMALAEGNKIGFYASPDLLHWEYRSGFIRDDLGLLECPDLFEMSVDGDPSRTTWVLGASANGDRYGRTTGYAYWTGTWDGSEFHPDSDEPQWLDDGPDFYAAVTWSDDRATRDEQFASRYALGWVNNWAYARDLPTAGWQGGTQSLVRRITLAETDGRLRLRSTPLSALDELESIDFARKQLTLSDAESSDVPSEHTGPRRVRLELSREDLQADRVDLTIGDEGAAHATLSIDTARSRIVLDRSTDAAAAELPEAYRATRSAPFAWVDGTLTLDAYIDGPALEVFINQGEASMTALAFVDGAALTLEGVGGTARVDSLRVSNLSPW